MKTWRQIEEIILNWLSRADPLSDDHQIEIVFELSQIIIAAGKRRSLYFMVFKLISGWLKLQKEKLLNCSDESFLCLYKSVLKTSYNVIYGDIRTCLPSAGWRVYSSHMEEIRTNLTNTFISIRLMNILNLKTPLTTREYFRTGRAFGNGYLLREEYIAERRNYDDRSEINKYLHVLDPMWKKPAFNLSHLSIQSVLTYVSFNCDAVHTLPLPNSIKQVLVENIQLTNQCNLCIFIDKHQTLNCRRSTN